MNEDELEKYKKKLEELKEEVREELSEFEDNNRSERVSEHSGEISEMTTHPADRVANSIEQEQEFDIASREGETFAAIKEALQRIKEGNYGQCVRCSEQISKNRLDALPYARLCVECKKIVEQE